mmetsp:Transcript_29781/g.97041  ORF Transcript_29781/g.97041 Transcript_29781/m.97041 type:complete len:536 (+) Transcript_29781:321-1928(+)
MRERLHLVDALLLLDFLHVCAHASNGEVRGEPIRGERIEVEPRERDELEDVPELADILDVRFELVRREPCLFPVEGRAQIVRKHLIGKLGVDAVGKLGSVRELWLGRLHPNEVGMRSKGFGALHTRLDAGLEEEVPFARARFVPAPLELAKPERGCEPVSRRHPEQLRLHPPLEQSVRICEPGVGDGITDGFVVRAQLSLSHPPLLHVRDVLLRFVAGEGVEQVHHRRQRGVGRAEDEGLVADVPVAVDEVGRLGVGARHDDRVAAHDVALEASRDEAVDVLLRRNEHLAAHVTALFRARLLVLEVHARRATLDKHLDELHNSGEPAVAGVGVRNHGEHVVHGRSGLTAARRPAEPLLALLAVVELLSLEELLNLVRHRVHRVVGNVRTRFVRGARCRAALPTADVDGCEVLRHSHRLSGSQKKGPRSSKQTQQQRLDACVCFNPGSRARAGVPGRRRGRRRSRESYPTAEPRGTSRKPYPRAQSWRGGSRRWRRARGRCRASSPLRGQRTGGACRSSVRSTTTAQPPPPQRRPL